ncbi:MAG: hypothetical protein DRI61_15885, partial [Chloroflexi bacterium]
YLDVPVNVPIDIGGVKVYYFHTNFPSFLRYSRQLKIACKKMVTDFDIIHITSFWNYPGIPAAKEATKAGIPYVVSTRGTLIPGALSRKLWKKWLYLHLVDYRIMKKASAIHFTTRLEMESTKWLKRLRIPNFIIPNGLNFDEFNEPPSKKEAKKKFGFPIGNFLISYLGRLDPRKGLDVFIRAFRKIANIYPHVNLVIAGPDYGYKSKLRDIVSSLELQNKVTFIDYISPKERNIFLSATDLFVLPAYEGENFGNAAVEAMAAGVPVLISENVGICDAVREDGAGLVVPVDEDAIANALIEMLSNPERLKELGKAAYESARKRYDIRIVAKLMATAYEDILTGRRSPELQWEG